MLLQYLFSIRSVVVVEMGLLDLERNALSVVVMNNTCIACGRDHEEDKLEEMQDISKVSIRRKVEVGDKVTLEEDWGIVDEGSTGIIGKFIKSTEKDVGQYVEVAFNPRKPFDLEKLKEFGKLSISGGPIKRIPLKHLERTTEVEKTAIHKHSPRFGGQDIPQVKIFSKVWKLNPENLEN